MTYNWQTQCSRQGDNLTRATVPMRLRSGLCCYVRALLIFHEMTKYSYHALFAGPNY